MYPSSNSTSMMCLAQGLANTDMNTTKPHNLTKQSHCINDSSMNSSEPLMTSTPHHNNNNQLYARSNSMMGNPNGGNQRRQIKILVKAR